MIQWQVNSEETNNNRQQEVQTIIIGWAIVYFGYDKILTIAQ